MKSSFDGRGIKIQQITSVSTIVSTTKTCLDFEHTDPEICKEIKKLEPNSVGIPNNHVSIPEISFVALPEQNENVEQKNASFKPFGASFNEFQLFPSQNSSLLIGEKITNACEKPIISIEKSETEIGKSSTIPKTMNEACSSLYIDFTKMIHEDREYSSSDFDHFCTHPCLVPPNAPAPDHNNYGEMSFSDFHNKRKLVPTQAEKNNFRSLEFSEPLKKQNPDTILNTESHTYLTNDEICEHQIPRSFSPKLRESIEFAEKTHLETHVANNSLANNSSYESANTKKSLDIRPISKYSQSFKIEKRESGKSAYKRAKKQENGGIWNI